MQAGALFSGQEYQLELLGNFSLTPVAGPFSAGAVLTAGNDTTVLVTLNGTVASQPHTSMLMVTQVEPRLVTTMPHMLRSVAWQPTRERNQGEGQDLHSRRCLCLSSCYLSCTSKHLHGRKQSHAADKRAHETETARGCRSHEAAARRDQV